MAEKMYDVVFDRIIKQGENIQEVKLRLAKLFRTN